MKYKVLILIGLLILITTIPVSADDSFPTPPAQIYGTLYNHEGKPFPVGTVVTAEVNGILSTYTITEAGKLGGSGMFDDKFLISGVSSGDTITFSVSGSSEKVTTVYNPDSSGQAASLNVVLPVSLPSASVGGGGGGIGGAVSSQPIQPTTNPTQTELAPTQPAPTSGNPSAPQPTETEAKSPLGIIGVFAGLGAVAVLRRR